MGTEGFHLSAEKGINKIESVIEEAKGKKDKYKAASVYLKELISKHPFADGNYRTAYIMTLEFLRKNSMDFISKHTLSEEKITEILKQEIKFKSLGKIARWIKKGEFE